MLSRIYLSESEKQTISLARHLVEKINRRGVICLYGGLGTGKTVFAKGCSLGIGAQEKYIKSPTFAFIRELKNKGRAFFHCDFYRIANDDEILHHSLNEILRRPRALVVIEWAQNLTSALPPDRIDIFFEYTGRTSRRITILEQTDTTWIYKLYKKYHTPQHVIKHMEVVADLAHEIALRLIKKGKKINLRRVIELALLHDLLKHKSFQNREINDVELTSAALGALGRKDLSHPILTQQFEAIISPKIAPTALEEKIVYYADKRVKHSRIVALSERLRDGRKRYWQAKPAPKIVDKIEKKIFELEEQLAR
ncbi:tRNA (adenosine(37)-N6)-threonylcarbamoyltransferase complex ATPase subunit type 1 TsaE [Candidatus Peregrinibacteria bacterium]|nr:tRNA (adenosine(37)-N6)-threonylcarbamoyltransferase complex ATPase subunit type 1 TsaE [Candidatus Peregrinibacteria bacterium]